MGTQTVDCISDTRHDWGRQILLEVE